MDRFISKLIGITAAALLVVACHGFVVTTSAPRRVVAHGVTEQQLRPTVPHTRDHSSMRLYAEEEETDGEAADETDQEASGEEAETPAPPEDPELTKLKEEIANLESQLKSKRREVSRAQDTADKYTQAGYSRRVAEMENMRKARRSLESLNKYSSQANIVADFLPVMDQLLLLRKDYGEDNFGKQYNGLAGAFGTLLKKELSVTEYEAGQPGEAMDAAKVLAVGEEFSDQYAKGTILRPLKVGLELQGNVLRMAECVVSLGSEADFIKAQEEEAAAAKAAAEAEGENGGEDETEEKQE